MHEKLAKNGILSNTAKLKVRKNKRKFKKHEDENIEDRYEEIIESISKEGPKKNIRFLLPVKTKEGIVKKRIIEEEVSEPSESDENASDIDNDGEEGDEKSDEEDDEALKTSLNDSELILGLDLQQDGSKNTEEISNVELMARRNRLLNERKIKIGLLASSILENPENKCRNLKILVDMMEEKTLGISISVRKLTIVSLLEVFKDLLPSYKINNVKQEGVKFKKETLHLQSYETIILKYYKIYLQKLEKLAGRLRIKKGDTRTINEPEIQLGELAISSMCTLLIVHPYFNFSFNITNFLIPFLNNKRPSVRETVAKCFMQIFKEDKKAELSLTIVRKINQLIKTQQSSTRTEVLSVLLALRLKEVNLDKEREDDHKQKKLENHKSRILALSKRERKRNKKLEQVEKELLETKAEEDKVKSHKILTEIASIIFTIYFRILKQMPNSKLLSTCLEGLAKFAHCINLEFYQDLVSVIDDLMENGNLGQREQLHCIQTVFMILSGQGSSLNIDPHRFYNHLYRILLDLNYTKSSENCEIIIKCLVLSLINRRKRVTQTRLIAFIKRIATISLQLQHHEALGLLTVVKTIFQLCKSVDILLDTDSNVGDGIYQPELTEPEHCNAHCSALWELAVLQRHYHSVVQKVARNVAFGVPTTGEGSLNPGIAKLSPEEIYLEYKPAGLAFKPPIPAPKKNIHVKTNFRKNFASGEFENYVKEIRENPLALEENYDFYKLIKVECVK